MSKSEKGILAWHFLNHGRKLGYGDGRRIVEGNKLTVTGEIILCERGLHASISPLDALRYASSSLISRVVLSGDIVRGDDKIVASERTTLWIADASDVLHGFACRVAWDALKAERAAGRKPPKDSWNAIRVKRLWLEKKATNAELAAAESAAWAAAESAARWAARWAAWSAESAARSAAWSAAWWAAESAAGWAARSAAWSAAWWAAESAAGSAAGWAAESAAESAARSKYSGWLDRMLRRLAPQK